MPFLAESTILEMRKEPTSNVAKCGICQLYKKCKSPKFEVQGKGKRKILIVGEFPTHNEDRKGKLFRGDYAEFLEQNLVECNIDMRNDCWLTNSIICTTPDNKHPTKEQLTYCHPNLKHTIEKLQPNVIVTLGYSSLAAVLKGIWTKPIGPVSRWSGFKIPCRDLNTWIIPLYHPSTILDMMDKAKGGTAAPVVFLNHLKLIKKIKSKPFDKIDDLKKQIKILTDEKKIVKALKKFIRLGGYASFDYETNMLKPDHPDARIHAVSVCWEGKETIAFPFHGKKVVDTFRKFLRSKRIKKFGFNIKFEDRWSRKIIKTKVFQWTHDGMIQAHTIDNRKMITSLDFQAFVLLGVGTYSKHISPLFEADGSYQKNRIKEIDLEHLLFYNAMDALTTFFVAKRQMKILKI